MKSSLLVFAVIGILIFGIGFEVLAQEQLVRRGKEELLFEEIPVVFAAAKFEQKVEEASASITVITSDEIKRYGYRTLGDVLRAVTGLYVINDRTYEYLGVRGYYIPGDYGSRVLILFNGLTLNDSTYGTGSLEIDIETIKRIEIIKGPASALYGTYALFCVINLVTRGGGELDGIKISGRYGSYQSKEGGLVYGKKLSNGLEVYISGSVTDIKGQDLYFPEFDTPETNNGIFEDGDKEEAYNFLTKFSYADFTVQSRLSSRNKTIPTSPYGTIFNDNRTVGTDGNRFVELKYTPKLDETKDLLARIYCQEYFYEGAYMLLYTDELGEDYKEKNMDWTRNDWFGSEVQLNWRTSKKNQLIFGEEYQNSYRIHQRNYDEGLLGSDYYYECLNDKRKLEVWSFYLQDIYKVKENLSLTLGGRYDHYSTFGKTINPRVGIVYNLIQKSTVKLLYGSAFRAPTFYELYYHDGYYSSKPNPDIKPEELETYEAVFERELGKNTKGILSLYWTTLSDIISQVESEELSEETGEPLLQFVNGGKARANGIELTLKGKWKGVEGKFGYNLQKAEDRNTGKELVNSPKSSGNFGLSFPFLSEKTYLTVEAIYIGKRLTIAEEWLDSYLCTNLILFSSKLLANMEVTLKINNFFDESYADPCSTEHTQTKISQNRRNFSVKIDYKL